MSWTLLLLSSDAATTASDERVESGTHMIDFVLHIIFLECNSGIRLSIDGCFIKVFREEDSGSGSQHSRQVAEGILGFFPGFEAFSLPLPTADEEIMRTISVNKDQLQTKFLRQLEDFKRLVKSILVPKHSYTEGELVTGEGLLCFFVFFLCVFVLSYLY